MWRRSYYRHQGRVPVFGDTRRQSVGWDRSRLRALSRHEIAVAAAAVQRQRHAAEFSPRDRQLSAPQDGRLSLKVIMVRCFTVRLDTSVTMVAVCLLLQFLRHFSRDAGAVLLIGVGYVVV